MAGPCAIQPGRASRTKANGMQARSATRWRSGRLADRGSDQMRDRRRGMARFHWADAADVLYQRWPKRHGRNRDLGLMDADTTTGSRLAAVGRRMSGLHRCGIRCGIGRCIVGSCRHALMVSSAWGFGRCHQIWSGSRCRACHGHLCHLHVRRRHRVARSIEDKTNGKQQPQQEGPDRHAATLPRSC